MLVIVDLIKTRLESMELQMASQCRHCEILHIVAIYKIILESFDSMELLESLKILCFKNVYFRFYGFVAICIEMDCFGRFAPSQRRGEV